MELITRAKTLKTTPRITSETSSSTTVKPSLRRRSPGCHGVADAARHDTVSVFVVALVTLWPVSCALVFAPQAVIV